MDYAKKRIKGTPLGEVKTYSAFTGMTHAEKVNKLLKILKEVTNSISDLDPHKGQMMYDSATLYGMKFKNEGRVMAQAGEKIRECIAKLEGLETRLEDIIEKME